MTRCCLTVDVEDWSFDTLRRIGAVPRAREAALHEAYDRLSAAMAEIGGAQTMTFFTTGQVARDCPSLVRRIAKDGHEIGCHGLLHDHVSQKERRAFGAELDQAIDLLGDVSGQRIRGYRAPMFSVRVEDQWALEEIAARFDYDASLAYERRRSDSGVTDELQVGGRALREVPFCSLRLFGRASIPILGGTYLKLLTARAGAVLLREAARRGFLPMIYLHPYELLYDGELSLSWDDLAGLPAAKRLYWQVRQHQWISVGNKGSVARLRAILGAIPHVGRICDLLGAAPSSPREAVAHGAAPE